MNSGKATFYPRLLAPPERSFFLFGPRGTGKSTWVKQALPEAVRFDLLDASLRLELTGDPHRLEALAGNRAEGDWIVLDEVQKIPALLDEVHRLMESRRWRFALCGSSARKLRRGGANLLAGRAVTLNMEGLCAAELAEDFALPFALDWGFLPFLQHEPEHAPNILAAYLNTYLREEVREEGLVRQEPPFARFLTIAGQLNGQVVNAQNIAREAGVGRRTVDTYFSILTDTLLGHFLPAWRPGLKVREVAHPKFYWFDTGVARAAAGLLRDPTDRASQGVALETVVFHELRVLNETSGKHRPIFYYGTPAGVEVDFVIQTGRRTDTTPPRIVAIETKLAQKWNHEWDRPLRALASTTQLQVDRLIVVYTGERTYHFGRVEVLPVEAFLQALHRGEVF